ncbi:MAG: YbaK/EbsC family protein [Chloroflexota bacterium]
MPQTRSSTNATRLLQQRGVAHQELTYDDAIHSAVGVSEALGIPAGQVFKTLVALREPPSGRPLLIMIPGPAELDLKVTARAVAAKAIKMATHRDAERLTGLKVGGIGALALTNRPFDVFIDSSALDFDWILVNGGKRGLNVRIGVTDLIAVTGAAVITAARPAQNHA